MEETTNDSVIAPYEDRLKAAMNPSNMVAMQPPPPAQLQMAPPPPITLVPPPRPMLPPPPLPLVPPNRMHAQLGVEGIKRPETPYARELREKAAGMRRPTLCDGCGGLKRINEKKDKRGNIVGFDPCPKCVELA